MVSMRLIVLFALSVILSPIARAELPGVQLKFRDKQELSNSSILSNQLAIDRDVVAVFREANRPAIFTFDGRQQSSPSAHVVHSMAFAGDHAYVLRPNVGITCYAKDGWREIETIKTGRTPTAKRIEATPDGTQILVIHDHAPAELTVYSRDAKTGTLMPFQVFQSDEVALTAARELLKRNPGAFKIMVDEKATRVEHFDRPSDIAFGADGETAFIACKTHTLIVLIREVGKWRVVETYSERNAELRFGLIQPKAIAVHEENVFVGGNGGLSWIRFNGTHLSCQKYWVDDSRKVDQTARLPFLDNVLSLAVSKNGEYLFLANADESPVQVLKVADSDITPVGSIDDSPAGTRMLEVKLSPDGKHLFAKSTTCRLLIYDLDERFWR